MKKQLVKDSDGYKYFNGTTLIDNTTNDSGSDTWELLPNQSIPTQDIYETYGKYIITSANGLQDKVRFLVSSINEDDTIDISGKVNKTIVETKDTNTSGIDTIKSITFTGNTAGATIKFAAFRKVAPRKSLVISLSCAAIITSISFTRIVAVLNIDPSIQEY